MHNFAKISPENRKLVAPQASAQCDSAALREELQTRIFSCREIADIPAAAWQDLARHAAEPNIFYERALLLAACMHLETDEPVRIFTLWSGNASDSQLIALVPLAHMARYSRWRIPHVQNWKHPNCFLGAPLVREGCEHLFWTGFLAYLNGQDRGHGFLHLNGLVENGPLIGALRQIGSAQRRPVDIVHREHRAFLRQVDNAESYYAATVRKKKRKELARLRNRLAEEGELTVHDSADTVLTAASLKNWADSFLALEHAGWKGENGSALGCCNRTRAFFIEVLETAHADDTLHLVDMRLNGKPIAMLVNFRAGRGGFSFKTAFDEHYAKYSPGVLLQIENLGVLQKLGIDWIDSCAAEGHPMIDSLWADRRTIVRVSVALGGARRRAYFAAIRLAENAMATLRSLSRKDAS